MSDDGGKGSASRLARCVKAFEDELDYVYRVLRRHGVARDDVEDLAQDVFIVLWRRWDDFTVERPLRPWLAGIAMRVAQRHGGRRLREVPSGELDRELHASPLDDRISARALLLRVLEHVPQTNRTAMILHDLDGLSMPEVARALSIPLATAYTRVGRGRRSFIAAARKLDVELETPNPRLAVAPTALLALGREDLPMPPELRQRILARVRALPPPAPRTWLGWRPLGLGAGLAGASLVAITIVVAGNRFPAPPAHEAIPASARVARPAPGPGRFVRPVLFAASATVPSFTARPAALALGHGLIGDWRFDDGSALGHDGSGRGNDCRIARSQGHDQGSRRGLRLGRNVPQITCTQPPAGPTGEASVAFWLLREADRGHHQTVLARQRSDDQRLYYRLATWGHNLVFSSAVWNVRLEHAVRRPFNEWVHVAFTRAASGTITLYLDGAAVAEAQGRNDSDPRALADRITLGSKSDWQRKLGKAEPGQRFTGALDDLLIYDRALSDAEIGALAEGAQPGEI